MTRTIKVLFLLAALGISSIGMAQQVYCAKPAPTPTDGAPDEPPLACKPPDRNSCQKCSASPCYAKSGAYFTSATDLYVSTPMASLEVRRNYESWHSVDGPFGHGWSSNLNSRVYLTRNETPPGTFERVAVVVLPSGTSMQFQQNADGTFNPPAHRSSDDLQLNAGLYELRLGGGGGTVYRFSADGLIDSVTDELGNSVVYEYDSSRRVSRVRDGRPVGSDTAPSGRYIDVVWNPSGRIDSVTDNSGRTVSYGYDAVSGTLTSTTDPGGRVTEYAYIDGRVAPLLSGSTDHWGRTVEAITWDERDRVHTFLEAGETYTMSYNLVDSETTKTDSAGRARILAYDWQGLVTNKSGSTQYNPNGSISSFTDSAGEVTEYIYGPGDRLASVTYDATSNDGVGEVTFHYTYDVAFPDKVAAITPRISGTGSVYAHHWQGTAYDYHPASYAAPGALAKIRRISYNPSNQIVHDDVMATYQYNSRGQVTSSWVRDGGTTTFAYEADGDLASVTAPVRSGGQPQTTYTYDVLGRMISSTDPMGMPTTYTYDGLDRIATVTPPRPSPTSTLDFTTRYDYDSFDSASGLVLTRVTDPNGRVTASGTDAWGRVGKTIDAAGNATTFAYLHGNLASITDSNGNVTSYGYDPDGRQTSTTFPDGASETTGYRADGLLAYRSDRRGITTSYTYDAHQRLKQKNTSGDGTSTSVGYTYEGQKLVTVAHTRDGATELTSLTYTPAFLIQTETQGAAGMGYRGKISYSYHPGTDLLEQFVVEDGGYTRVQPSTSYLYNGDGTIKSISWSHVPNGQFEFDYRLDGQYSKVTFPNGQTREYLYDDQGRLTELANMHPQTSVSGVTSGGVLARFRYGYDRDWTRAANDPLAWEMKGQRTSVKVTFPAFAMTDSDSEITYSYDANYQLTESAAPADFGGTHSWAYDAIGNRTSAAGPYGSSTYSYLKNGSNPNNGQRLASISGIGATSFQYDQSGNTTARGADVFTWNHENQMATLNGQATEYDFQGRRSVWDSGVGTFTNIYVGQDLVADSRWQSGNYYWADYLFAPGIDEPLARATGGGNVEYYAVDALGSVVLLTTDNPTVSILEKRHYTAWGERRSGNAMDPRENPFGYTAREYADGENLYYRARVYRPQVGRFMSEDPLGLGDGINVYSYAQRSPVNFTDPSGMKVCRCERRLGFTARIGPHTLYLPKIGIAKHEFIQFVPDGSPCGGLDGTAWGYQNQGNNVGMVEPESTPDIGAGLACAAVPCIDEEKLKASIHSQIGVKGPYQLSCTRGFGPGWNRQNCQGWVDSMLANHTSPTCENCREPQP